MKTRRIATLLLAFLGSVLSLAVQAYSDNYLIGVGKHDVTGAAAEVGMMGYADPAVDKLLDQVEAAKTRAELTTVVKALDRVLRSQYVIVPRYYKKDNWVAYYNMYEHPETLPPYALGELSIWWYNAEKADALKAKGVLK